MFEYVFFYRYASGVEGFGYYADYEEAEDRMFEFRNDSKEAGSKVEFGIARIEKTWIVNIE